jgi:GT2 family glycosyltransferase
MPHHHGLELAVRLGLATPGQRVAPWHTASGHGAASPISPAARSELACSMLRSRHLNDIQQTHALEIVKELSAASLPEKEPTPLSAQLDEARRMKRDGRFSSALELVEQILADHPEHQPAKQLKIEILERKRRFVEASELKHELGRSEQAQKPVPPEGEIKTSIVIPTALYGQAALEHCLISLAEHCNPETTELVVIDNASLDDTHDYLSELREKGFFRCTVITNKQNAGFAASVNQGLEKARGEFACILHNDVEFTGDALHQLERLMDAYTDYALIGPLARNTLNPDQSLEEQSGNTDDLREAEYLDSFCMMLRMDTNLRMDEAYRMAFFEDIDLCFQARAHGLKVGVATGVRVEHHFGTTTYAMNLDTDSEAYWKNVSYFNEKWNIETYSEEELKSRSRFDQLMTLDAIVNPVYPEDELVAYFNRLFTDEVKTEILKSEHDSEILCRLVHLMMVMDQREVMRRLEDRLDDVELPASLAHRLIRFYFNRNIYSRCTHYLDRLTPSQESLQSKLYKLEILVNEKELDAAVPMLRELLEKAPSNPRLYKLAGDIHRFEGNEEEALSFYRIAHQINPFEYSPEGVEELRLKS